jgi:carbon monoxide dehydrogenase subunit G
VKLSNTFEIDRPVVDVFDVFLEIDRVATCMPGSRLTGQLDDDTYEGEVKIKVGPLSVVYAGQASFVEIDREARQLTMRAKGREKRGAGNVDAVIVAQLREQGRGTQVVIDTDLSIRGKVAQFGQGAIGEVAGGLMKQFAHNVEVLLSSDGSPVIAKSLNEPASSRQAAVQEASHAEDTGVTALNGWALIVLPLALKALPTVAIIVGSGVASYIGARIAIGRATRRR